MEVDMNGLEYFLKLNLMGRKNRLRIMDGLERKIHQQRQAVDEKTAEILELLRQVELKCAELKNEIQQISTEEIRFLNTEGEECTYTMTESIEEIEDLEN